MTYYPAAPGDYPAAPLQQAAAPADATGTYPALAGYTPMETGRRIVVALGDGLIGLVACLLIVAVPFAAGRNAGLASALSLVVALVYAGASFWALLARSSRLAGLPLGAQYVDVTTGLPAGGKLFGKFLLTAVIGGLTFGIAPLIMYFATLQEPLKRNWFDRTLGLMLVDLRTGRRPGTPLPPAPVPPRPATVAPVRFPGSDGDPAGFPTFLAGTPAPPPPAPTWSPPGPPLPPPGPTPASTPAPPGPMYPPPAIQPISEVDGVITRTPRSSLAEPAPVVDPPVPSPTPVVVRELRSVDAADAADAEKTLLAEDASLTAGDPRVALYLDDTTPLRLDPPTVIGRNPVAPGSHPDAAPVSVDDRLASKTHLLVGLDDQGPWVLDLHSTNGVLVARTPGADPQRVPGGRKVHLAPGAVVRFGAHRITVR